MTDRMDTEALKALVAQVTPGPWSAEDFRQAKRENPKMLQPAFENGGFMVFSEDCDCHPVADCSCNHTCRHDLMSEDGDECGANARLIALAPTLTAEVLELRAEIERLKSVSHPVSQNAQTL